MIILRQSQFSERLDKNLGSSGLMTRGLRKKLHEEYPDLSEAEIEGIVKKEDREQYERVQKDNSNSDSTLGIVVSGKRKSAVSDKRISRARELRRQ